MQSKVDGHAGHPWHFASFLLVCAGSCTPGFPSFQPAQALLLVTESNATGGSTLSRAPSFNPAGGIYASAQNVAIQSDQTTICYTVDGSAPSCSGDSCTAGNLYSAPVNVATATTIRAVSCSAGTSSSEMGEAQYTIDTLAPTVGTAIASSSSTTTSITLSWGAAADNISPTANLEYRLVKDDTTAANLGTLAMALAKTGGDLLMDWTAASVGSTATGLAASTTYHFAVIVRDQAGNQSLYSAQSFTTASPPGALDTSFSPGTGANDTVVEMAVQSDDKIVIVGNLITYNGTARAYVARVEANGALDTGFIVGSGASAGVRALALQTDGKILIGGLFASYNGTARNRIARLNSDGSLDMTFNPGTGADAPVDTIAVQTDGKIIIGGSFTTYDGTARARIARINADGTLDTTFDPGTGASNNVLAVTLQGDGKVLIGGNFTSYNGTGRTRLARINTDGSLDTSFNVGSGANGVIHSLALQTDGSIVAGGAFTTFGGSARNRIARVLSDGSLDLSFLPGTGANNTVQTVRLQSDGQILIGGSFATYNGTSRPGIARLNPDGSLEAGFNPGTGVAGSLATVNFIALQSTGRILLGGDYTSYNGTARSRLARVWN
ncbi:MAG: chitobiase/beta-hexosaminidase C-terminal domain-containing protein [Spirochaetales bacterium]|nr:chitobiase/beta-hexosaminidase C-terminal domain-containing protein [Spirochaetales bacterium]